MPRLPRITARDAERAIMKDGWLISGSRGSHRQYNHPTKAGRVTIPMHRGATLDPKTTKSIVDQAGLTVGQFFELL
jgi:predicted RNA binding protein YcfA (HicA-like mRNA interferase family)